MQQIRKNFNSERKEARYAQQRRRKNWVDFALARGNPDSRLVGVVSPARVHLSRPLLQKIVANVVGIGELTQLAPAINDGDTEDVGLDS